MCALVFKRKSLVVGCENYGDSDKGNEFVWKMERTNKAYPHQNHTHIHTPAATTVDM